MSGESLRDRIDFARSSMIVVVGGSFSSLACWSSVPQPSSHGSLRCVLNRCSMAQMVPRPFCGARAFAAGASRLA